MSRAIVDRKINRHKSGGSEPAQHIFPFHKQNASPLPRCRERGGRSSDSAACDEHIAGIAERKRPFVLLYEFHCGPPDTVTACQISLTRCMGSYPLTALSS